jgi:hypothetical protein
MLPPFVRRWLGRRFASRRRSAIDLLWYDLAALERRLEAVGVACEIFDAPTGYWSRDFRRTRSNLLIHVPAARITRRAAPAGSRLAG